MKENAIEIYQESRYSRVRKLMIVFIYHPYDNIFSVQLYSLRNKLCLLWGFRLNEYFVGTRFVKYDCIVHDYCSPRCE